MQQYSSHVLNVSSPKAQIPTGLLVQRPGYVVAAHVFYEVAKRCDHQSRTLCITLNSGRSPNLRAILKLVNRSVDIPNEENDEGVNGDEARVVTTFQTSDYYH